MTAGPTRTVTVDPHCHTVASYDGELHPEDLLERAEAVGLDGVCVTDHDTLEGARVAAELATGYEVAVIVGCEVSTADGHLLAIGVDSPPEPGLPLPDTARRVRARGGLAVVPHPFQRSRHGASAGAIAEVDGIEVYNAHTLVGLRNEQAGRYARRHGYSAFGGSDAHRAGVVGSAATAVELEADRPPTPEALLGAMRDNPTTAVGHRTSAWQYVTKLVATARYNTSTVLADGRER